MSTQTQSQTNTYAYNVRAVWQETCQEIGCLANAFAPLFTNLDIDGLLVDCSVFLINSVISSLSIEFYYGNELVREYRYVISEDGLSAYGPPASQPPLGGLPAGSRVRIVVHPNPEQTADYCDAWFRRLNWFDVAPLIVPDGLQYQTYGAFTSGNFGMERQLRVNPRFDQPVSNGHSHTWSR